MQGRTNAGYEVQGDGWSKGLEKRRVGSRFVYIYIYIYKFYLCVRDNKLLAGDLPFSFLFFSFLFFDRAYIHIYVFGTSYPLFWPVFYWPLASLFHLTTVNQFIALLLRLDSCHLSLTFPLMEAPNCSVWHGAKA
ncbi:hypothetical protein, unlikely [Trypanosoma brucei gambiense DAL972]|uniref:Uncharacterized protein n=1 Tax=Trypanosoma brucei gambiense (strain MHOM/CI/86/DAL972) TaxID=679716 RepID=C9ZNN7_TRYB9|nr:hypothetical protein, unlikely [Trypanosoma brucei gambiense DAL972]CBH11015.1 hypothetical protein, unlikely [Trypanosoma brucei gambiense DAL972]|eukprot:XP_011773302.1 hypothetical protein, unlikely [Trypanosoma brucei gambiense DAL972]